MDLRMMNSEVLKLDIKPDGFQFYQDQVVFKVSDSQVFIDVK
jgi:hypothetical protein